MRSQAADHGLVAPIPARAWRSAALNLAGGGWTKIPLDTLSFDAGGHNMDVINNHRYNVPVTGYYQVHGQMEVTLENTPQQFLVAIWQNGNEATRGDRIVEHSTSGGDVFAFSVSDILHAVAGDYFELLGHNQQATAVPLAISSNVSNRLTVMRVG